MDDVHRRGRTMLGPCRTSRAHLAALVLAVISATPAAYSQDKRVKLTLLTEPVEKESTASQPRAHEEPTVRPWWIGGELGDGQLKLTSDQSSGSRNPTFGLGFAGGHKLGNWARIGLELNGWLLQSFNLSNPAVGESVSNVLGIVDAFPIKKTPIFLRAGAGLALYQNNRPNGFNGNGWSWTAGGGYEFPLTGRLGLAPIVDYAAGSLGDVNNLITVQTGRHYSVVEFKAAIIWHFGSPN